MGVMLSFQIWLIATVVVTVIAWYVIVKTIYHFEKKTHE